MLCGMNLAEYVNEKRGTAAALADELGIPRILISQWSLNQRPVPLERCVAIERATAGKVTRRDLRPDDWQDIWPELGVAA